MIRVYFLLLWKTISRPSDFFRGLSESTYSVSYALTFALISHWLGTSIGYVWSLTLGSSFTSFFESSTRSGMHPIIPPQFKDLITQWFFGVGPIILDPFLTLASLLFTSIVIFAGARIFITPGEDHPAKVSYETVLKILSFGMGPAILAAFPLFGGPLAHLCIMIATVIGFRTVFHIGTGRALVVFLFPNLLFLGIIGMGIFSIATLVLKLL